MPNHLYHNQMNTSETSRKSLKSVSREKVFSLQILVSSYSRRIRFRLRYQLDPPVTVRPHSRRPLRRLISRTLRARFECRRIKLQIMRRKLAGLAAARPRVHSTGIYRRINLTFNFLR